MPDDVYLINQAKTEFREVYNTGNVDQLLSVFDDNLIEMSQGEQSAFGEGARVGLRSRATALFAAYHVKMVPIVIDVFVNGSFAYDFGWHEMTLTPKSGGEPIRQRVRYLEHWRKNAAGQWKISFFMDNQDLKEAFNGEETRWFRSEDPVAV